MCVSHFARFSVFLAIVHVLTCKFLIFLVCQFSRHIPVPTGCISNFPRFSMCLTFSMSYSVCFSFAHFSMFLTIFQVLPWFSHFPRLSFFLTYARSYSVCFSFSTFFIFLAILQVLMCICVIFHVFRCLLPYSRSYSVCVSFSTIFSFFDKIQVL